MPAYANLADLMRQQGRDSEGERVLTEGLARVPDERRAAPFVRASARPAQTQYEQAVAEFAKAAALAPDDPRYAYVHAVALQETGTRARRWQCSSRPYAATPPTPTSCSRWRRRCCSEVTLPGAKRHAQALARVAPRHPNVQELLRIVGSTGG